MKPFVRSGMGDEAIYYGIMVCALFNFYTRWIDATGVHALSEEAHARAQNGAPRRTRASNCAS
jgi:hypothetical protein